MFWGVGFEVDGLVFLFFGVGGRIEGVRLSVQGVGSGLGFTGTRSDCGEDL